MPNRLLVALALAALALAALTLTGCDTCVKPLAEWCDGPCPTYEAVMTCEGDVTYRCAYAIVGSVTFVEDVTTAGENLYFDDQGKLIAVHAFSDISELCGGHGHHEWYGRIIECDEGLEPGEPPCPE